MIYIETNSTDVYYNFGLEYYFAAVRPLDEPVFLFWRTQPTVMVGKYQNTFEEIDLEYAERKGIQVVRRLSGGGTIYTDLGGWQFTFIQYGDDSTIHFHEFIEPVIGALKALNVPAKFNGRNDLVIGGKKFSGNAQYKLAGNTVHHGSTLFATDIEEMVRVTTVDPEKIISKSIKSVRDRVTNIRDHLSGELDAETFKKHMVSHIMKGSEKTYEVTAEDSEAIQRLADEKFRPWQARFGANPKFSMIRSARYAGGRISFRLDVVKGIITRAQVTGDFFGNHKAELLGEIITGLRLDREELTCRLLESGYEHAIYGITPEEMVNTILS